LDTNMKKFDLWQKSNLFVPGIAEREHQIEIVTGNRLVQGQRLDLVRAHTDAGEEEWGDKIQQRWLEEADRRISQ
jgi:hypothetical protein